MLNKKSSLKALTFLIFLTFSCENRPLHDAEEFRPKEIHENIEFHFDRIEVDGVEYLILEKDNNNPHEGFGFMAFRANQLMEKQDTILAYLKASTDLQAMIYANLANISLQKSRAIKDTLVNRHLREEMQELLKLEQSELTSRLLGSGYDDEK
jgi:hypothetical protein